MGGYTLTPSVRRMLKRPLGELIAPDGLSGERHLALLAAAPLVVTVGDRVTETVYGLGRTPDVQVVDEKERRMARTAPAVPYARLVRAGNPAGTITEAAYRRVADSLVARKKPVRVLVEGEEDLLAIPAVAEAPLGSLVYYGQPLKGVVLVRVDERARSSALRTLDRMRDTA